MHKVNTIHQAILDDAESHGINLEILRKKYGLPFVIRLSTYLKKKTEKGTEVDFDLIDPKEKEYKKSNVKEYISLLEEAGIRLYRWTEDFVDEDTGEVVSLPRYRFCSLDKTVRREEDD